MAALMEITSRRFPFRSDALSEGLPDAGLYVLRTYDLDFASGKISWKFHFHDFS